MKDQCKYCISKSNLPGVGVDLAESNYTCLWMNSNELGASGDDEAIIKINYCPMCGRKLEPHE